MLEGIIARIQEDFWLAGSHILDAIYVFLKSSYQHLSIHCICIRFEKRMLE